MSDVLVVSAVARSAEDATDLSNEIELVSVTG